MKKSVPSAASAPRMPAIEAIWLTFLVLIPAAINRLTLFAYAIDRRLLLHGMGIAALVAIAVGLLRRKKDGNGVRCTAPVPVLMCCGAIFLIIRLVSALFGLCPENSILGSPVRDDGWLSQLSCALMLVAMVLHARRKVQRERILVAVCLGSFVPVVVGLLQCAGVPVLVGPDGFPEGRIWSTFGNAILFGSYLVGVIPATVWTLTRAATHPGWSRARRQVLALLFGVWTLLELFLLLKTGSRGPLLGLVAAGAVSVLLVLRARGAANVAKALSLAMVAGILLVLGGVQLIARSDTVRTQMDRGMLTRFNTVEFRLMCYEAMTDQLFGSSDPDSGYQDPHARLRPWLGYGSDCLEYAILKNLPARYELVEGKNHVPDSTHSATMDVLGSSGLLGILALAAVVACVLRMASASSRMLWAVLALSAVGAGGMMLLWGAHTWALGAVTGCGMGILLLAGAWQPGSLRPSDESMFIASAAMALALWLESQSGVYSAMSSTLLHVGLAGVICCAASRTDADSSSQDLEAEPSPFGVWCLVALAVSIGMFLVMYRLQGQTGALRLIRKLPEFQDWLDGLVHDSAWAHAALPVAGATLLAIAGNRCLWAALVPGGLCLLTAFVLGTTEWRLVDRDIRVSCASDVAVAGRPDIALGLLPDSVLKGEGVYAPDYADHVHPWLNQQVRNSELPEARRETFRAAQMTMAVARAKRRPYDAYAWRSLGDIMVATLEAKPVSEQAPQWVSQAENAYRRASALMPGSNVVRQLLAKVLYVYKRDIAATQAMFDEMLALEPENPVALSMRATMALQASKGADDEKRLRHLETAYLLAERTLRSPSLGLNGVDREAVRRVRDEAKAGLLEAGHALPELPVPDVKHHAVEAPVFEKTSELHLGQSLLGAGIAMAISFLLVPLVRRMALRAGWIDAPAARKVHREPTPLLGGLAILAGVWTVALAVPAVPFHGPFLALIGVATGLACVGVVDDRWPLPWQIKIAVQFGAALLLYTLGVRVQLAWLPRAINLALTVFWLVGVTNAVNFLDNMNGLSNGLAAWSSAAVSAIALVCGEWDVAAFALALTGACIGFLRGNNPWRGSIFMGDTGSLFLGFTLASLALLLRFPNNENWVTWLCPVLLLAVPVFDMTHVCLARLRRGCNPFSTPGKDHTSHLFEKMGLSRPMAVLAVHALVLLCAVATWIVSFSRPIIAYAVAGAVLSGAVFLLVYFELRFGIGGTEEYRAPSEARAGFTLLELLTVVVILGILASLAAPMINNSQRQARQADCRSNLRQFGIALASYRSDHNGLNPPWMSNLFPDYVDGKDIYVCKSDREVRKKPSNYDPIPKDLESVTHYSEVDDFKGGSAKGRNDDVELNSYFYEFCGAKCSWDSNPDHDMDGDGEVAWWESKEWQLRYGDKKNDGGGSPENPKPYSTARMPIIRCWHHWQEDKLLGFEVDDYDHTGKMRKFPMVLNVGYAGNVFSSPPWWEGRPDVGE